MRTKYMLLILGTLIAIHATAQQKMTRYAFVDADCKPGFAAIQSGSAKRVLSNVFALELEPAALMGAEENIAAQFRDAMDKAYPGSRNQFNGIYVYLYSDHSSAEQKRADKLAEYLSAGTGLLDFQAGDISLQGLP